MTRILIAAAVATLTLAAGQPAVSQTVAKDWEAHKQGGYCYNVSLPKSSDGAAAERGAYVAVRHDIAERVWDSVSFVSGLGDVTGSAVTASIDGGKALDLLAFDSAAFAESGAPEQGLIRAMRRGRAMKVTWRLPDGRSVTDSYSLMGFTATHRVIDDLCSRR